VQIFMLAEAVSLMRSSGAHAVVPVGWPPLAEAMGKAVTNKIQIYACGACSRARSVTEAHFTQWGAKFGNPTIFVSLVEWADRIITE
jgi:sulfur relay (sulfurtransferase) complex TusBCD TusD component (DsrE family)